jgi:spore germination protein KC
MGKKISLTLLIMVVCFVLAGCWDYQEIKNVTNVAGVAIDKGEEKKFKFTFETVVFKPSAEFNISVKLVETEGDTIFEGLRNAVSVTGKRLYIGHCKAIIFSEEVAKEGIQQHLDFFVRDHELRMTLLVFVAKGVEAKKTLKDSALIHQIASYELERLVRNDEKYSSLSKNKLLYEVLMELLDEGIDLTLPVVEIKQMDENQTFTMEGVFYFKDDKLEGYIEPDDIKFLLMFLGELKGGIFNIPIPENSNHYIVYEIQGCQTALQYEKGENLLLNLEVKIDTFIGTNQIIYSKQFTTKDYQRMLESWLKNKLEDFFEKLKNQIKSDICGFEKLYFQKQYKQWLELSQNSTPFLEQLDIQVKVKASIKHSGIVIQ